MFSSRPIFINILASFDPLHRSRCPHRSLFESQNLLKILIKLDLEKSLNQFIFTRLALAYALLFFTHFTFSHALQKPRQYVATPRRS